MSSEVPAASNGELGDIGEEMLKEGSKDVFVSDIAFQEHCSDDVKSWKRVTPCQIDQEKRPPLLISLKFGIHDTFSK